MLILDEGKQREQRRKAVIERTREITISGADNEGRDRAWVEDRENSVSNAERQTGRKLTVEQFMEKVNKLNRDIVFKPHWAKDSKLNNSFVRLNRNKGALYLRVADKEVQLFPCEGDWMPEWSIFTEKTIRMPDRANPDGPWKEVQIPNYVDKRGWRECLMMLIQKGLLGLEAVERSFGAGNRPSWKVLTGKGMGSIF